MTLRDGMLAGRDPGDLPRDERRELLSAYLDGELPAEEARRITLWLDEHPDVLREVEHLRRTWDLLEHYPDEPVPAGFASRVLAALGIARPERAPGRLLSLSAARRNRALLAVAAVLLIGLGVLFSLQRGPQRAPGTPPAVAAADVLEEVPDDLLLQLDKLADLDDEAVDTVIDDYENLLAEAGG